MINCYGVGRLTDEPTIKNINEKTVANFRLAFYVKADETIFANCSIWGERVTLLKYAKKGDRISVSGRLRPVSYTKKDGSSVETFSLDVDNLSRVDYK